MSPPVRKPAMALLLAAATGAAGEARLITLHLRPRAPVNTMGNW